MRIFLQCSVTVQKLIHLSFVHSIAGADKLFCQLGKCSKTACGAASQILSVLNCKTFQGAVCAGMVLSLTGITGLLLCINTNVFITADKGTTNHLQEIFMGRCWEYQEVNVGKLEVDKRGTWKEKNCLDIWNAFHQDVQSKQPCKALPTDFKQYFALSNPGATSLNKVSDFSIGIFYV